MRRDAHVGWFNREEAASPGSKDFLGALASNAGDDLHVFWAAREVLGMHDASNDVHAVKVECPPQVEAYALLDESGQVANLTLMLGSAESTVCR